jgi:hypothetical protein
MLRIAAIFALLVAGWLAFWSLSSVSGPKALSSSQDQHAPAHLESLPVTQIENYALVFTAAQPTGPMP